MNETECLGYRMVVIVILNGERLWVAPVFFGRAANVLWQVLTSGLIRWLSGFRFNKKLLVCKTRPRYKSIAMHAPYTQASSARFLQSCKPCVCGVSPQTIQDIPRAFSKILIVAHEFHFLVSRRTDTGICRDTTSAALLYMLPLARPRPPSSHPYDATEI